MTYQQISPQIIGFALPDEKSAFRKGGKSLIVYKFKAAGTVPTTYSKTSAWITEHPNFWILKRKR